MAKVSTASILPDVSRGNEDGDMKERPARTSLWKTNQATDSLLQSWGTRCTPPLGGKNALSLQTQMGLLRMRLEALGHGDTGRPCGTLKWLAR